MPIKIQNKDLIPEIGEKQMIAYARKILSSSGGCVEIGPFNICAEYTPDPIGAEVIVTFAGDQIGECQLDSSHPDCEVQWADSAAKIDMAIVLNIPDKKVVASGTVCVYVPLSGWQCISRELTVYSWQ